MLYIMQCTDKHATWCHVSGICNNMQNSRLVTCMFTLSGVIEADSPIVIHVLNEVNYTVPASVGLGIYVGKPCWTTCVVHLLITAVSRLPPIAADVAHRAGALMHLRYTVTWHLRMYIHQEYWYVILGECWLQMTAAPV